MTDGNNSNLRLFADDTIVTETISKKIWTNLVFGKRNGKGPSIRTNAMCLPSVEKQHNCNLQLTWPHS